MDTIAQFLTVDRVLEAIGFTAGLLYLYWEYHADAKMWLANIAMPTVSFWVYYRAGLYADFGMNIYYFGMAIYGFAVWTRHKSRPRAGKSKPQVPISHIGLRRGLACAAVWLAVYAAIAAWLVFGTDSTVPYIDAFTTSLSIVATWMLARKYIEQWLVWLVVDAVSCGLYFFKDRPFYGVLYGLYTVIAIFGYAKWKRLMSANKS